MQFDFHRAADVADAVRLLGQGGAEAKPIAGGTALVLGGDRGEAWPRLVVGVGHLTELQGLDVGEGGIRLGAALRLRRLEGARLPAWAMAVVDAASSIASPALRGQATLGGDLAHGAHTADLVPVAVALDGRLELTGPAGGELAASAIRMRLHDALPERSLVTALRVAAPMGRAASAFVKFGIGQGMEYPLASVALALDVELGVVARARVALGAAASDPVRLTA
ncbi:MAG: FAD binding domain-containing protein, partial [Candidatus Dormiibacterota bacterium]